MSSQKSILLKLLLKIWPEGVTWITVLVLRCGSKVAACFCLSIQYNEQLQDLKSQVHLSQYWCLRHFNISLHNLEQAGGTVSASASLTWWAFRKREACIFTCHHLAAQRAGSLLKEKYGIKSIYYSFRSGKFSWLKYKINVNEISVFKEISGFKALKLLQGCLIVPDEMEMFLKSWIRRYSL